MNKLNIKTERLIITEFTEGMAESVYSNSLDEDNRRFTPDEVFETKEDALAQICFLESCYGNNNAPLVYPILLKSGQHIGHVQAVPLGLVWEIGYHIGKKYTGKGYASEAVKAFLPVVMERLGLDVIYAICVLDNKASRKVLHKCGFMLEFEGMGPLHGKTQSVCRYKLTVE